MSTSNPSGPRRAPSSVSAARQAYEATLVKLAMEQTVRRFCAEVPYPPYERCVRLLRSDIELYCEYGETNHECLREIYGCGFLDADMVRANRDRIVRRGGLRALTCNYHSLNRIMLALIDKAPLHLKATVDVYDEDRTCIAHFAAVPVLAMANKQFLEGTWFSE